MGHPRPPNRKKLRAEGPLPSASCALLSGARSPPSSEFRFHTCSPFLLPEPTLDPSTSHRQPAWHGPGSAYTQCCSAGRAFLRVLAPPYLREERSFSQPPRRLDLRSRVGGRVRCLGTCVAVLALQIGSDSEITYFETIIGSSVFSKHLWGSVGRYFEAVKTTR